MTTDNKTLADVQPGGRVRLEQGPRDHRWDDVGERCLDCGDKDWMGGACSGPRAPEITAPWSPIGMAPNDGEPHIRGLWVTSRIDGAPATREWRQFIGLVNDDGAFVDPDYGETFGWEADQFDAWMPLADAPGAALTAQPSPGATALGIPIVVDPTVPPDTFEVRRPSPGGQGDARAIIEEFVQCATLGRPHGKLIAQAKDYLAARQPVESEENVAADTYWTLAEMIEPHVQREGINPDGALPASVHDSVAILLEHWLRTRQPVGEPVAWMTHHDEPMLFPTAAEAAAYCEDDEQPVPLFRSPAQAVDLVQFRDVVADWRDRCCQAADKNTIVNMAKADRLLALIDSKGAR